MPLFVAGLIAYDWAKPDSAPTSDAQTPYATEIREFLPNDGQTGNYLTFD
jgi:hypothetical protein